MRDRMWVCKDGRRMLVAEMTTLHVVNSIAMIKRIKGWRRHLLKRLELELEIRSIRAYDNSLWG
jgi:hypothetical protein